MKKIIQYNLIALVVLFITRSLVIPMDSFSSDLGNLLWLPMGGVILSYLLFGFRVFPGVLIGYLLAEVFIEGGTSNIGQAEVMSRVVNSLLPLVTIALFKLTNIGNVIEHQKINYFKMLLLIVVASVLTTVTKVILTYGPESLSAGKVYFQSYVQGDIFGAVVFIVIVFTLFSSTLSYRKII
jgi:integral membrane sensor domain MASE1